MSYNPSTINISVTASGGVFVIDGVEQKTLELFEGNTYVFSYPSAHPLHYLQLLIILVMQNTQQE